MVVEYNHYLFKHYLKRTNLYALAALTSAWDSVRAIAKHCDTSSTEIRKIKCVKGCPACPNDKFKHELLDIIKICQRDCRGLCLVCMQTADELKIGKKCCHKVKT